MRKSLIFLGLLMVAFTAHAAVTVDVFPTSLVTSATEVAASTEKAVFKFSLTGDASETLDSVSVTVNSDSATASDFSEVSVYRDDGDESFDEDVDTEIGSNSSVNVDSATVVNLSSNNEADGDMLFVVLHTSSAWSATDSVTVTLNANGLETSEDSPTTSAVTTAELSGEDTTGPALQTALAMGKTGGTSAKEAGDKIVLTFNEETNEPVIDEANIDDVLALNNSHSWLDGDDDIGSATWSNSGKTLTVVLSAGTSLPTVALGDTVTVSDEVIEDEQGNEATGTKTITGSFTETTTGEDCDEDEDEDENGDVEEDDDNTSDTDEDCDGDGFGRTCASGIINGKLYKAEGASTVYLAAGCRLKPFRGAAVFHARGHKFQNILPLPSLEGITVSDKPALPAGGTLVKGSDKTVWFVTEDGKRKGFTSENAFKRLGFSFGAVKQISDSDLQELLADSLINENSTHPEGAVVKCTTSQTVYMMKGNKKLAFTNPQPYLDRGHTWDAIAVIDCATINYPTGENITQ